MNRLFALLSLAIAIWLLPVRAEAQDRLPPELQAYIENAMAQAEVPGVAVAVVRMDDPPIAQGFGLRRLGSSERVDADTLFNIASLAKSFTAASGAILVDEGKMAWTDRVARRLPELEFSDPWLTEHVTIGDLLSHRTGLQAANSAFYPTGIGRAELVRRVRHLQPAAPFRTEQVYNNALYVVAGEAIGAAAGMRWEDHVRARLLRPLGMTRTLVGTAPTLGGNVASPHAFMAGRQQPIAPADYRSTAPAGGIESSARDMARWLRFQLGDGSLDGKRILSPEMMQAMHQPWVMISTTPAMRAARQVKFFAGYGLGWNVMDYRGRKLIWHSGNADGMPSYMALLPEERIGVIVMVNSWVASSMRSDLASRILDHYLGLPARDYAAESLRSAREAEARAAAERSSAAPAPATLPPLDLAAYGGEYRSDLYGPIFVRKGASGLILKLGAGDEADLQPLSRDTFTVRWRNRAIGEFADTRVTFGLDDDGKVVRLAMRLRRDTIEAVRNDAPGV
jgi:CubicO group peptidase (beta-lactamase class C family)